MRRSFRLEGNGTKRAGRHGLTQRSELAHRLAQVRVRFQMKLAKHLFSLRDTWRTRVVKKLLKAYRQEEYSDPDSQHPGD